MTLSQAQKQITHRNTFGSMMLHVGDAEVLVSGVAQHFPDTIRPALEIVRVREGLHKVSGCSAMITRKGDIYFFLVDTSLNIEPSAEDLVEIALCAAQTARRFDVSPASPCFRSRAVAALSIRNARKFAVPWNCCMKLTPC